MDFQAQFDQAIQAYAKTNMFGVAEIPAHSHTGVDSNKVDFTNLTNKKRYILYRILDPTSDTSVLSTVGGDFVMPFKGIVTSVGASVDTAGVTSTTTIDIKKNGVSILSTKITINSTETTSRTAATESIVDGTKQSFLTGDIFTFDITAISTTPAKGLTVFINVTEE